MVIFIRSSILNIIRRFMILVFVLSFTDVEFCLIDNIHWKILPVSILITDTVIIGQLLFDSILCIKIILVTNVSVILQFTVI